MGHHRLSWHLHLFTAGVPRKAFSNSFRLAPLPWCATASLSLHPLRDFTLISNCVVIPARQQPEATGVVPTIAKRMAGERTPSHGHPPDGGGAGHDDLGKPSASQLLCVTSASMLGCQSVRPGRQQSLILSRGSADMRCEVVSGERQGGTRWSPAGFPLALRLRRIPRGHLPESHLTRRICRYSMRGSVGGTARGYAVAPAKSPSCFGCGEFRGANCRWWTGKLRAAHACHSHRSVASTSNPLHHRLPNFSPQVFRLAATPPRIRGMAADPCLRIRGRFKPATRVRLCDRHTGSN